LKRELRGLKGKFGNGCWGYDGEIRTRISRFEREIDNPNLGYEGWIRNRNSGVWREIGNRSFGVGRANW
jgi:hypothetical protein